MEWLLVTVGIMFFAAFVTGVVLLILYVIKQRKKAIAWLEKRGFREFDASQNGWLRSFQAWGPGYGHRNFRGYQGDMAGVKLQVWQHRSRTKSKDGENTYDFIVVHAEAPITAPKLVVKKERIHHKVFDALGGEDIDFESNDFSRKFWVRSDNRKFAYDVIDARMMQWFLQADYAHLEWQGRRLVLHAAGGYNVKRVQLLTQNAVHFLKRIPRHVTHGRT